MTSKQIHQVHQTVLAAQQTVQELSAKLAKALKALETLADGQLLPVTTQVSKGRDRNKWLYNNEWYGKGQLPLAVFKAQVDGNYTLQELQELFAPEKIFPNSVRGNKIIFKPVTELRKEENSRFHLEILHTKDSVKIRVSNQWGTNNFFELLGYLSNMFDFPVQSWEE